MEGLRLLTSVMDTDNPSYLRKLDDSFFVGDREGELYDFVKSHYRRYNELPSADTCEEEFQYDLPNVPETAEYYFSALYDRRMFNEVRPVFNELRHELMGNNAARTRELAASMATRIRDYEADQDMLSIGHIGSDVMQHFNENRFQMGMTGIPTGWEYLDKATGGYQPGDLIAWVARPGVGKTHMLIKQSLAAFLSHKRVMFCSMEMTLRQIGYRFYAQHAGVNPDLFRKGTLSPWSRRKVEASIAELATNDNFTLVAGDFQEKSVTEVVDLAREYSPDILYIDGIYIMKSDSEKASRAGRFEKVAYILDDLKQAALTRSIPIVGTSQFGRGAGTGGEEGSLETVGYTDAFSTHTSILLAIKFPKIIKDASDRKKHKKRLVEERRIEIMKGREGEFGEFKTNFCFSPVDFNEIPQKREEDNKNEGDPVDDDWGVGTSG